MSLLGKLKTAIKGNPVIKEYEIGKQVASAGPGLLWKVHNAIKKSTQQVRRVKYSSKQQACPFLFPVPVLIQEVSVFLFSKVAPELEKVPKKRREAIYEMLRRCPTNLARLRHPHLLMIEHPVEESRCVCVCVCVSVCVCMCGFSSVYTCTCILPHTETTLVGLGLGPLIVTMMV